MFTYTFRLRRSAVVATLAAVVIVVATLVLLPAIKNDTVPTLGTAKTPRCASNAERVEWLQGMGWEIEAEPCSELSVVVPQKFDELYAQYAIMQRQNGFRIEKYKGKTVEKYCYLVLNYGDGKETAVASILQRGDKIIAADLSSARLGGFLKPLLPRDQTKMK